MKKILLATLVGAAFAGTAFAQSAPVTDFSTGTSHLGLTYNTGSGLHGYSADLSTGITDRVAVQYTFNREKEEGVHHNYHTINGYYKVNDNFNVIGTWNINHGKNDYQVGVVGYTPIQPNLEGFGKVALGDYTSVQLGVKYDITDDFDATAFYQHDNGNGRLHVGLGYKF